MYTSLTATLWPQSQSSLLSKLLIALAGTLLLTLSSKIQIPFYPVPLTMQTFVVLTLGMALGWKLAGFTVLLYLFEGTMGLPVFAGTPEKGLGLAYMLGGTGGYLAGFVLGAMLCGYLAQQGWDRRPMTTALAMFLGNIVIYIPGLIWLGVLFGWDKPLLEWGFTPFILGDVVKLALACVTMPIAWKIIGKKKQ